jgi:hypothetical protein
MSLLQKVNATYDYSLYKYCTTYKFIIGFTLLENVAKPLIQKKHELLNCNFGNVFKKWYDYEKLKNTAVSLIKYLINGRIVLTRDIVISLGT